MLKINFNKLLELLHFNAFLIFNLNRNFQIIFKIMLKYLLTSLTCQTRILTMLIINLLIF